MKNVLNGLIVLLGLLDYLGIERAEAGALFLQPSIAAGSEHTCTITNDGVRCWGLNGLGGGGSI